MTFISTYAMGLLSDFETRFPWSHDRKCRNSLNLEIYIG